ncbi:aspartate aminotransferase family protein [Algiphilus sp.]|uniref:class-III pyridoxal-phosphate-dependent aminotransferase n=1 Tax=Algiphilus sp. TaxID=1872431 RepID=UPI0032EFC290
MSNWTEIERWDRAYYLHNVQAQADYTFLAVDRADGNFIQLADGSRLLDFQSQLVSDSMGHRHPAAVDAVNQAMTRYGHVFFGMANEYRARAAKLVIEEVLAGEDWPGRFRVFASGTEAVESALAMARLYTGRPVILTQAHSFHGSTMGATWLRGYRNSLNPGDDLSRVVDVPGFPVSGYIPIPPPEPADAAVEGVLPSITATESIIRAVGAENIAAVITEPMFGAGGLMPHDGYYPALRELSRRHGFLWIDDEVLCGFGRLGEWFGYQRHAGIHPDLMVVGKGINGSLLPSGGVVAAKAVAEYFDRARWWSGSTWDGHPLVCASIVGNLEYMLENDVLGQVRVKGERLRAGLAELAERHPCVGRVGGAGLYFAVDLVNANGEPIVPEDRYTGFTGDLGAHPNHLIAAECARHGVFLGGFVPNTVKVAPPFTVNDDEIDQGLSALDAGLSVVDRRYA